MAILSVQIDSVINMVRDDVRLLKTISSLAMFEWIFLEIEWHESDNMSCELFAIDNVNIRPFVWALDSTPRETERCQSVLRIMLSAIA